MRIIKNWGKREPSFPKKGLHFSLLRPYQKAKAARGDAAGASPEKHALKAKSLWEKEGQGGTYAKPPAATDLGRCQALGRIQVKTFCQGGAIRAANGKSSPSAPLGRRGGAFRGKTPFSYTVLRFLQLRQAQARSPFLDIRRDQTSQSHVIQQEHGHR